MHERICIVNCAELAVSGWCFLKGRMRSGDLYWSCHDASPIVALERMIQRPKISRYRAAIRAALAAGKAELLITHLPRMTWWVAVFCRLLRVKTKHIAFSFNFTDLPGGATRWLMAWAFRYVDRFIVYSSAERDLYADFFAIDPSRIDVLPWAMSLPATDSGTPFVEGDYICAVGGEGRDYKTLIEACRELPDIPVVMAVRPENLEGLALPDHVRAHANLPATQFWNVVRYCRFAVIPLRDQATNCGHISIVGCMLYGKPIVSTYSSGTTDYLRHGINALMTMPADMAGLRMNIAQLWQDSELHGKLSSGALNMAGNHDETHWIDYLERHLACLRQE